MPRLYRTIKTEILDNEKLGARCSRDARALFKDLILLADDQGRLPAATPRIRSRVYPYDDDVTVAMVEDWLRELYEVDSIRFYEVNGSRYIELPGWSEHQYVQHPSKTNQCPAPASDERVAPHFAQLNIPSMVEQTGASEPPIPTGTVEFPEPTPQSQNGTPSSESHEASGESHEIDGESHGGREGKGEGKETPFNPGVRRVAGDSHETLAGTPGNDEDASASSSSSPVTRRKPAKADLPENQRPEIRKLCKQLADRIAADGVTKRPDWQQPGWHAAMRLLVDQDLAKKLDEHGEEVTRPPGERLAMVEYAIDWIQTHRSNNFSWGSVILCPENLRQKWPKISKQIIAEKKASGARNGANGRPSQQAVQERTARRLAAAAAGRGSG